MRRGQLWNSGHARQLQLLTHSSLRKISRQEKADLTFVLLTNSSLHEFSGFRRKVWLFCYKPGCPCFLVQVQCPVSIPETISCLGDSVPAFAGSSCESRVSEGQKWWTLLFDTKLCCPYVESNSMFLTHTCVFLVLQSKFSVKIHEHKLR